MIVLPDSLGILIKESRSLTVEQAEPVVVDVRSLLPHREPMLLIDGITGVTRNKTSLKAHMSVRRDDPVLRGHFPHDPVYPGVLLVEAIAQAGVCLVKLASMDPGERATVRAIKLLHAEFVAEVRPGDVLEVDVKTFEVTPFLSVFGGRITCGGELKTVAVVEVYVGE